MQIPQDEKAIHPKNKTINIYFIEKQQFHFV